MSKHVLVIEDDVASNNLALTLLEGMQFTVRGAFSSEQAFDLVAHEAFDLILVDLSLPGLSGWDFLTTLKEHNIHIPCVAMTVYDSPETKRQALAFGFDAYVAKPYELQHLLQVVNQF
ncbi:MAG: response regulator [Phototrophicaceae bacterium]